jgi:tetratricopeptide (TPR) repeat protein
MMRRHLTSMVSVLALLVAGDLSAMPLPEQSERWIRVDTAHLALFSNASEPATVEIGLRLEAFRAVLSRIGPDLRVDSPLPTSVYVFGDDVSFHPYKLRQKGQREGAVANLAGFFVQHRDGNYVGVNATPPDDPWAVIYHEYFHFFLYNNFTDIPLWFSEGMAECYSTFRINGGRAQIGGPIRRHAQWLKQHPLISPRRLFAAGYDSPEYGEQSRQGTFYAESWALVQYLLWGSGRRTEGGVRFLRELPRGASLAEGIAPVVGLNDADLEERLTAYVKKGSFALGEMQLGDLTFDTTTRVTPLTRDEVLYRLGDFLLHSSDTRLGDAERHFREAIRINPAHGPAHAGVGQILSQRKRYEEAHTAFEKAVELDPSNHFTSLAYAYALISEAFPPGVRFISEGEVSPALARARELFQRTTRAAPEIAEAWAGLGATCVYDQGGLAPGIAALEKARQLLPSRMDVAVNLAGLYARGGQRARAQDLVDRVISGSSDPELRAAGKELLFRADLTAVDALLVKGDIGAGRAGLQALLGSAPSPELKGVVENRLRQVEAHVSLNQQVAQLNEAVAKANAEQFDAAEKQLERLLASPTDPQVTDPARRLLAQVREVKLLQQAVDLANKQDHARAAETLRRLLGQTKDPETTRRAKDLLVDVEAARQADLYNQAVEKFKRKEYAAAAALLDRLPSEVKDPLLARSVRALRDHVKQAMEARPAPPR